MPQKIRFFAPCPSSGKRWSRLLKRTELLERWERNHEAHDRRRIDRLPGWRKPRAGCFHHSPERVRGVPPGDGTHRGVVCRPRYHACAGTRRELRTTRVATDCAAASGETLTLVGRVF